MQKQLNINIVNKHIKIEDVVYIGFYYTQTNERIRMIFKMPECGGCRTCEIACSFKHLGKFNADVSSLQVLYRDDGPGYCIRLAEDSEDDDRFPCDLCKDRETPECLEYCHEREKLKEILDQFRKSKNL